VFVPFSAKREFVRDGAICSPGKENNYMRAIDAVSTKSLMKESESPQMVQKLGNTIFDVYVHFSQTSKETMSDKVMRLIRNEMSQRDLQ
jgi:hypothetical protein